MKLPISCLVLWLAPLALAQPAGAPVIGPRPAWTAPAAQVKPLASGARAWVLSRPGLPVVHVAVSVSGGSWADPAGQAGLAALTASAMELGGTSDKTPAEVLAAFDALGTLLHVQTSDEGTTLSISVLAASAEPALRLLVEVLTRPRFDPFAFESVKSRRLAEIAAAREEPRAIADEHLRHALFGATARGFPVLGTAATVSALTLDDVKRFHAAHDVPSATTFILAGDITPEQAQKVLDAAAPIAWLSEEAKAGPVAAPLEATQRAWVGVDRPGLAQTVLRFGTPGLLAKDPRKLPASLASIVLGGSFTSRLVQNLREKHGYTYGARAWVEAGRAGGAFGVATAVKSEVTAEALEQALLELKGLTSMSAGDLERARALFATELVGSFDSGLVSVLTFAGLSQDGLPPDDLAREGTRLAAVTLEQVVAAAKDFDPDGYTLVLVGDRAKIEKALAQRFPKQAIGWVSPPRSP